MIDPRIPSDDIHDELPADLGSRPCVPVDGRAGDRVRRERGLPPVTDESRMLTAALIYVIRTRLEECGVRAKW